MSGLVGRVGALKSCPYANLRAGLAEIPKPPRGQNAHVALWRAGLRAEEGARKPPALSQRSPRTIQRHSAPGRPLLNLPLRLRYLHPAQAKIMVTTTAQRRERVEMVRGKLRLKQTPPPGTLRVGPLAVQLAARGELRVSRCSRPKK